MEDAELALFEFLKNLPNISLFRGVTRVTLWVPRACETVTHTQTEINAEGTYQ
jgi:hypothetical protein